MGSCTAQTSLPLVVYSSTQLPLISDTSRFPSDSGVSPLGDPTALGGSWVQLPGVPIWSRTVLVSGFSTRTRQFIGSATVMSPLRSR